MIQHSLIAESSSIDFGSIEKMEAASLDRFPLGDIPQAAQAIADLLFLVA